MPGQGSRSTSLGGWLVALAVAALAAATGVIVWQFIQDADDGGAEESGFVGMLDNMRFVEAVVELADVTDTGEIIEVGPEEYVVKGASIASILYRAPDVAPLTTGEQLVFRDLVRQGAAELDGSEGKRVVAFMSWADPEIRPDLKVPWRVMFAGTTGKEGFQFIGNLPSPEWGAFEDQLVSVRGYLHGDATRDAGPELDLLVDWVREVNEVNVETAEEEVLGPITRAYLSPEREAAGLRAAWHAQSPLVRPLDPELTPPDVLADLTSWTVLVEVSPEAMIEGVYLAIRTPMGVAAVSELSGGTHPAVILVEPNSTWEVVILRDLATGEGPVVARVTPATRAGAFGVGIQIEGEVVTAALEASGRRTVAATYPVVTALTQSQFEDRVVSIDEP